MLIKKLMDIGRMEAGKVLFHKDEMFLDELLRDVVHGICPEENVILFAKRAWCIMGIMEKDCMKWIFRISLTVSTSQKKPRQIIMGLG